MPTKTLYVKDLQLWEEAKNLAGQQGLSEVVAQLLTKWVAAKKKANEKAFTRIELWVGGTENRTRHLEHSKEKGYKIAFIGRMLASNDTFTIPYPKKTVYQMEDGRLVVYEDWREVSPEETATYRIFSDYEELSRDHEALSWFVSAGALEEEQQDESRYQELFKQGIANALEAEIVVRID